MPTAPRTVPLVWSGALATPDGYGGEARDFVLALDRAGVDVQTNTLVGGGPRARSSDGGIERIEYLFARSAPQTFAHVLHAVPGSFPEETTAVLEVHRTMFETDSIPGAWVEPLQRADEVWVPSSFNLETFARGGVDPSRLHRIEPPFDVGRFDPAHPALELGAGGFVFLSIFGWGQRKGADVLVRAFLDEFSPDEPVSLVIKTTPALVDWARRQLVHFVTETLGRDPAEAQRIGIIGPDLADDELPGLYAAADAFVLASRGEGWGRPYMEAMAMELPVIGTRWSANLDFMDDGNSYLVDCEVVPTPPEALLDTPWFAGQRWAEPSVASLRTQLRRVVTERGEAAARATAGRARVAEYTPERAVAAVLDRLRAHGLAPPRRPRTLPRRLELTWAGPFFAPSSMALVNRQLARSLLGSGRVELTTAPWDVPTARHDPAAPALLRAARKPPRPPDVTVRMSWPPDLTPVESGRLAVILPWELGALPRDWLEPLAAVPDEIWAPTTYVRDCLLVNGLDPDRVAVVPHGVDPLRFNRRGYALSLQTRGRFRFLFVGGTLPRKGADLVLETYLQTFGPGDDVCLVVKDAGVDSFYRGQGLGDRIRALQADPGVPEILYLTADLPDDAMPLLYRACHALVAPYRGEGFALPILEGMACGLAVIATGHGACLDYCDPSVARLLPARVVHAAERRAGGYETELPPWWAEPDRDALAAAMRELAGSPAAARELGARASERVLAGLTWRDAASVALERIEVLAGGALPRTPRPPGRLSVCVIARDEEAAIGRCLESVRGLADQLVVVDTGSQDRTAEIAAGLGASVHHFEWIDDFAAARNEALRHAIGDWILFLDADEHLDPASHAEIRRILRTHAPFGYTLRTLNYLDERGDASVVEHANLRLFRNDDRFRYVGADPHAQLRSVDPGLTLQVMPSSAVIHHEGYRPSALAGRGKAERNRLALERAVAEAPDDPFAAFNLGVSYYAAGRDADAERALRDAIRLGHELQGVFPWYLVNARVTLALCLYRQERFEEAAEESRRAIALAPGVADAHAMLGASLGSLGRLDEAAESYERALAAGATSGAVATDRSVAGWRSLAAIGEIRMRQARWPEALDYLRRAHAANPGYEALAAAVADVAARVEAR